MINSDCKSFSFLKTTFIDVLYEEQVAVGMAPNDSEFIAKYTPGLSYSLWWEKLSASLSA